MLPRDQGRAAAVAYLYSRMLDTYEDLIPDPATCIEEMQRFIDRFGSKATKARQANARKKQVEKMELPEIKRSSRRAPAFAFEQRRRDAPRTASGIEHACARGQGVAVNGGQQEGRSPLCAGVLHGHIALRKAGQLLHGHGFGQLDALWCAQLGG